MPSPFHGIDLASRALRAFQRQLDVTGHNIGNVNTPGYSRQVVDLVQTEGTPIYGVRPFTLGNGVNILNVNRIRDQFLELRRLDEMSGFGRLDTMAQNLHRVQGVIVEPGPNGISDALDKFFNAWSALASDPSQPGVRQMVQSAGQTLATRIRGTFGEMSRVEAAVTNEVRGTLTSIDQISGEIAELNKAIRQRVGMGDLPNDLIDQRDLKLQELSELVDIHTESNSDGGVSVYVNQFTLIDSGGAHPIPKAYDAATSTVTDGTINYNIRGGRLSGLFATLSGITNYKSQLDTMANSLRSGINSPHATGINANGTTGINFFNAVPPPGLQNGAIDFDLDPAVLADWNNISAGTTGAAGDGGLALSISRLRDDTTIAGLGGKTYAQHYGTLVAQIGRDTSFAEAARDTQVAVLQQVDEQRQSISGVSLDDEMANMLRFQRSYQAAAKMLTVFDQVAEDLINMLRR